MTQDKQGKLGDFVAGFPKIPFDWHSYNNSQMKEKYLFFKLADELCQHINDNGYCGKGRKGRSASHKIFCMLLKTFLKNSSRRLVSDIKMCKEAGYLDTESHFNSVINYFNDKGLTRELRYLIELSAIPLARIEKNFAVDSTGFSLHQYGPWISIRQKHNIHRKYKKAHLIYGVLSNIAVSCIVTEGTKADSPQFQELLKNAARNFNIEEVYADLAYSSHDNLQAVSNIGGVPYIPFKKNAIAKPRGCQIWKRMFGYFKNNRDEYMKHYHQRSNAESGFSMIKRKFGEFVANKSEVGQINEILTKVLCHNICVLIQEVFLQGIEVDFSEANKTYVAQK